MIRKKDFLIILVISFFIALLSLLVLENIKLSFFQLTVFNSLAFIVGIILFSELSFGVASLLGRKIPVILQFTKFVAVGALNTLLDLGILNLIIFLSGITMGYGYSLFKAISFIVANINSYYWNKHWTFASGGATNVKEFGRFFFVSAAGFIINVSVASLIVNVIGRPENISPERWANTGAVLATLVALFWNFIGYKIFVFV